MAAHTQGEEAPIRDVFATQGMVVVLVCLLVCILHLIYPQYCAELLSDLEQALRQSPPIQAYLTDIWEDLRQWFSSRFLA